MEKLRHTLDRCTGDWRLVRGARQGRLECSRCGGRYPATPDLRMAAIDENCAGTFLRTLTAEGVDLLGS